MTKLKRDKHLLMSKYGKASGTFNGYKPYSFRNEISDRLILDAKKELVAMNSPVPAYNMRLS